MATKTLLNPNRQVSFNEETQTVVIEFDCTTCGEHRRYEVDAYGYSLWENGAPIADAFPEMKPSDRTDIMLSYHNACGSRHS